MGESRDLSGKIIKCDDIQWMIAEVKKRGMCHLSIEGRRRDPVDPDYRFTVRCFDLELTMCQVYSIRERDRVAFNEALGEYVTRWVDSWCERDGNTSSLVVYLREQKAPP